MKRIVSIQDISCLGRCSLTVALPVISAMGVECAVIPTAVLSAHTMFPDFTCCDLTDQILPIARHWQQQKVTLDAIYTGYLASKEQVQQVCTFFDMMKGPQTAIIVDPAMADHGRLYAGFPSDFPAHMARLLPYAHVAIPNITEACLMTGTPYREEYDAAYIRQLLLDLTRLGAGRAVLTGVCLEPGRLGAMSYDSDTGAYFFYDNEKLPHTFHGTGDIFAATVSGALTRGLSLEQAMTLAVDFTLECIRSTDTQEIWYGVEFEKALPWLWQRLEALLKQQG